eukprot:3148263-Pleurochrysis_carterae.AAC.2
MTTVTCSYHVLSTVYCNTHAVEIKGLDRDSFGNPESVSERLSIVRLRRVTSRHGRAHLRALKANIVSLTRSGALGAGLYMSDQPPQTLQPSGDQAFSIV